MPPDTATNALTIQTVHVVKDADLVSTEHYSDHRVFVRNVKIVNVMRVAPLLSPATEISVIAGVNRVLGDRVAISVR